jgi:hypothetical protein
VSADTARGAAEEEKESGDKGTRKRVGGGAGESPFGVRRDKQVVDEGVVMTIC